MNKKKTRKVNKLKNVLRKSEFIVKEGCIEWIK